MHLDGPSMKEVDVADLLTKVNHDDGTSPGYSPSPHSASKSSPRQQNTEGHNESLRRSGRHRNQACFLFDPDDGPEVRSSQVGAQLILFLLQL